MTTTSPKDAILKALVTEIERSTSIGNTKLFADTYGFLHDDVVGIAKSETAHEKIIMSAPRTVDVYELTDEGKDIIASGSPEAKLFNALPSDKSKVAREGLVSQFGAVLAPAQAQALKAGWIVLNKEGTGKEAVVFFSRKVDTIDDNAQTELLKVSKGSPVTKENDYVLKRKWLSKKTIKIFSLEKGPMWGKSNVVKATEITAHMLSTKEWKDKHFKINFDALGKPPTGGHLHPLLKVREEFRNIFLELGYEEMPTNRWVESSFWNFDSLFQPQQHPARDLHDTFFLSSPATTKNLPTDYVQRVKEMHEKGGHGSIGWRYNFSEEEMSKNILRTHTTAVSSRMLYKLAQEKPFRPVKYFSIDRVYRNEKIDATHLAEFHQIEGFIADYNITLTTLMGAIKEFFRRIGIEELKFKPAYNPYTEPSMEIFGQHPVKGEIEIGNSGIFRPEMLLPMGLPPGVGVAAWGLSLERPTMIMYGFHKITSLVGPRVDVKVIRANPIPKF